jgi:hypothetical protein
MYDYEKLVFAYRRFLLEYRPDYSRSPASVGSGWILDLLDYRQYKWPGHGISEKVGFQYVESTYMTENDYESLIDDPSDFWLRIFLPRVCGAFEGFKEIPPLTDLWEIVGISGYMASFGLPSVQATLKRLIEIGNEANRWREKIGQFGREANGMGFPSVSGGTTKAPFDLLADTLRGTREAMIDLYRRPELVMRAIERLTPLAIKQGVREANRSGIPVVFIPLHKGADGFMSDEQFRKFYWPSLEEVVHGLIEEGCIPYLFAEGSYNSRLNYLKELPEGVCICHFDRTDMLKAKEILKGRVCIAGNIPAGLLVAGSAEEVKDYCKHLIDTVGKDGGFILAPGSALDEVKPETLREMINFVKEYKT